MQVPSALTVTIEYGFSPNATMVLCRGGRARERWTEQRPAAHAPSVRDVELCKRPL